MSKIAEIGLVVLVACGGSGGKGTGNPPTATPTPTAAPTPTATPTAKPTATPTPIPTPTATPPATPSTPVTAPDPCSGLMPAAPLAVATEHVEPRSLNVFYAAGTSDGDGDFVATLAGFKFDDYAFYPSGGSDHLAGSLQTGANATGRGAALAPQVHGYHSLRTSPDGFPAPRVTVSDGKGQLISDVAPTSGGGAYTIEPDPVGGSAVLTEDFPTGTGNWLERFETDGRSRGVAQLEGEGPFLLGVATGGEALVATATQARWYDRDAKPTADPFPSGVASAGVETLVPLADGSLAVGDRGGAWAGIYRPGGTKLESSPAWLLAQHDRNAWVVRGGKATAFAPMGASQPGCGSGCGKLEILTADGQSCGTVELPGGSDEPVNVGKDGTVFALSYDDKLTTVHWRWWPKLLQ